MATVDRETIIAALGLEERPQSSLPAITRQWAAATGQSLADEPKRRTG
jgi:hypothetical protein